MDFHHESLADGGRDVVLRYAQIGAHIRTVYVGEDQQLPFNRVDCKRKAQVSGRGSDQTAKALYYVILKRVQSDILYMLNFISGSNYASNPFDVSDLHFLIFALYILYQ